MLAEKLTETVDVFPVRVFGSYSALDCPAWQSAFPRSSSRGTIASMRRALHLTTFILAWVFVTALIFTIIREAKGDTYFVPEGYLGGYLTGAIFFGITSYKTRPPRVNPPARGPDAQSGSI